MFAAENNKLKDRRFPEQ